MRGDDQNAAQFGFEEDNVFGRIATRYDRLCDIFSLLIHRRWKAFLAHKMSTEKGSVFLDVASGTGDIPYRFLKKTVLIDKTLHITDICPEMLELAKKKVGTADKRVQFSLQDARSFGDIAANSVDVYSIAFAMKICDRQKVMDEAFRVLKPGGIFYCLEASEIRPKFLHRIYLMYMDWCMPIIGKWASGGDSSAYLYLLKGVHDFPNQFDFKREIEAAGFENVTFDTLTLGIAAVHRAIKPKG